MLTLAKMMANFRLTFAFLETTCLRQLARQIWLLYLVQIKSLGRGLFAPTPTKTERIRYSPATIGIYVEMLWFGDCCGGFLVQPSHYTEIRCRKVFIYKTSFTLYPCTTIDQTLSAMLIINTSAPFIPSIGNSCSGSLWNISHGKSNVTMM